MREVMEKERNRGGDGVERGGGGAPDRWGPPVSPSQ